MIWLRLHVHMVYKQNCYVLVAELKSPDIIFAEIQQHWWNIGSLTLADHEQNHDRGFSCQHLFYNFNFWILSQSRIIDSAISALARVSHSVFWPNSDPGLCTSNEGRFLKHSMEWIFLKTILLFCFHTVLVSDILCKPGFLDQDINWALTPKVYTKK